MLLVLVLPLWCQVVVPSCDIHDVVLCCLTFLCSRFVFPFCALPHLSQVVKLPSAEEDSRLFLQDMLAHIAKEMETPVLSDVKSYRMVGSCWCC